MTVPAFLVTGALLLLAAALAVRFSEKTWFSPGALLLLVYGVHCFLDPTLRLAGVHPQDFNPTTWASLTTFNAACFAALVFGYLLPRLPLDRDKRRYLQVPRGAPPRPGGLSRRMFNRIGFFGSAAACGAVLAVQIGGLSTLGVLSFPSALLTDYKPFGYEALVSLTPILVIWIPALFVSAYFDAGGVRWLRRGIAWLLVGAATLHSMLMFRRFSIFLILITIALLHHFRWRRLRARELASAAALIGIVTFAALLRRAEVGIAELAPSVVVDLLRSGRIALIDGFIYTVMILEGQPVLSNVIDIVDHASGLFYGRTYVDTAVARLLPFDVPFLADQLSPRAWYREMRGFVFGSYGRGFSILAEAYMNFGRYGFVVFGFVGALARWLSFQVYTARHPVMLLWSAFAIVVLIAALREDSLPTWTRIVWYVMPLILFRWAIQLFSGGGFHAPSRTPGPLATTPGPKT